MSEVRYQTKTVREVMDRWLEGLLQVLESMAEQRPVAEWQPRAESLEKPDLLWWEQSLDGIRGATVWVGAERRTWEDAGSGALLAAGVDAVEESETRSTWFEIVGQSLGVMARELGGVLGREVTLESGAERAPNPLPREWASAALTFAGRAEPGVLVLSLSPTLLALIEDSVSQVSKATEASQDEPPETGSRSRTMELLLDVDLPVSISFGKARLPMKEVLKLTTGSIVELDRGIGDPVEVMVNQCLIARGEVVVVEGNYGVRIREIASRNDRLRSLK